MLKENSSDAFGEVSNVLQSFASAAPNDELRKLFPGLQGASLDTLFPVFLEVPAGSVAIKVRAGDGKKAASLCFAKMMFAGRVPDSEELTDVSARVSCSQSSPHPKGTNAGLGAIGPIYHNNVHTGKELEPWWQADIPSDVTMRYLYFYRRADSFINNDANIRVNAVNAEGVETVLYYPEGGPEHRGFLVERIQQGFEALAGLRSGLSDAAVPAYDHIVGIALKELASFFPQSGESPSKELTKFYGDPSKRVTDALLTAAYLAIGEAKDFGLSQADGLKVGFPRRKARYVRLRAFGELPMGFEGGEFGLRGAGKPIKVASKKELRLTYSRPAMVFPDSFDKGLTTRPQSRQVDFGSVCDFDYIHLWNINVQNASNTIFTEISCREAPDDPWEVIYDHGAPYRFCIQLLKFVSPMINGRWTPVLALLLGKLTTQYRRRALMQAVAKFTRGKDELQDAVFQGSMHISKTTHFASPLRLGKHGLGVPIAYRDSEVVMGHMAEMREKIRELGHKPLLMYGTLLGAIREKDFIPHDDDVDLAIIMDGIGPDELNGACDKFIETLNQAGVKCNRGHADAPLIHCHRNPITYDIFLLGRVGDTVYWPHAKLVLKPERADIFLPSKPIEFKGEMFDGPNDPEAVCEARYGSDWHIPNPAFEW